MTGVLWGVGVGPGDPDLLTFKAAKVIAACSVLAYPANPKGESQARAIVHTHIAPHHYEIPMVMDFAVNRDSANAAYDAGAVKIAEHLDAGRDVAVLCEGDPMLFGSFLYVLERLGDRYPVSVVPGISSVTAGAAALVQPLTRGDDRLAILPATRDDAALDAALSACDSVVIMKVGRHLERIKAHLTKYDMLESARLAEQVGRADERLLPLAEVEQAPYFSLVVARK